LYSQKEADEYEEFILYLKEQSRDDQWNTIWERIRSDAAKFKGLTVSEILTAL